MRNMKRPEFLALGIIQLVLIAMICPGCVDPVKSLEGTYSYKLSGLVTIDDTLDVVLTNEQGAMELIKVQDTTFLLTMNTLQGDAYTAEGVLSGDEILLEPFERNIRLSFSEIKSDLFPIDRSHEEYFYTEISCIGAVYDETIVFTLQYTGESLSSDRRLSGEDITMVAHRN